MLKVSMGSGERVAFKKAVDWTLFLLNAPPKPYIGMNKFIIIIIDNITGPTYGDIFENNDFAWKSELGK